MRLIPEDDADRRALERIVRDFKVHSLQRNGKEIARIDLTLTASSLDHAAATRNGIALAKKRGVKFGGDRSKGRRISKDKVDQIVSLRKEGRGINFIQRHVGVGKTTIYSVMNEYGVE